MITEKANSRISVTHNRVIKDSTSDKIYYTICYIIITLLTVIVLYPLIYILSASISNAESVISAKMWLWPVDISLIGYKYVLKYKYIWIGYRNTIFYTGAGTSLGIILTLMCAYPLARKNLKGRNLFMYLFTFTMIFNGGMIPNYMLMKNLNLLDTPLVMIIPGCMTAYVMIVTRTFLQSTIPDEMLEAAVIDGCSDFKFFIMFIIPLSKAIIAVQAVMYASAHWNSYFNAFLYLKSKELYPLQIFLRQILVQSDFDTDMLDPEAVAQLQTLQQSLKYVVIVVATVPMLALYPFAQKYFVQGVMIGSIKG